MQSNQTAHRDDTIEVSELKVDYVLASARSATHLAEEAFNALTNVLNDAQDLVLDLHRVSPDASKLLLDKMLLWEDEWHDLDQDLSWDDVADLHMVPNSSALQAADVNVYEDIINFGEPVDFSRSYNPNAERPLSIREQIAAMDEAQPSPVPAPEDALPLFGKGEEGSFGDELSKFAHAMGAGIGLDDFILTENDIKDERDELSDQEWAEQQLLILPTGLGRPDLKAARDELQQYLTKREMAAVLKERLKDTSLNTHERAYLSEERIRLLREAAEDEQAKLGHLTQAARSQMQRNRELTETPNKVEMDRAGFTKAALEYGYPAGTAESAATRVVEEPASRTPSPNHPAYDPEYHRVIKGHDRVTDTEVYYAVSMGILDEPSSKIKLAISEGSAAYAHKDEFRPVPMGDLILRMWTMPMEIQEEVEVVYESDTPSAEAEEEALSAVEEQFLVYTLLEPIGADRLRRYYFRSASVAGGPALEELRFPTPVEIAMPSQELILEAAEHREQGKPFLVSDEKLTLLLGTESAAIVIDMPSVEQPAELSTAAKEILAAEGPQSEFEQELVDEASVYSDDPLAEYYWNLYYGGDFDDASDSMEMVTVLDEYAKEKARNHNPEGEKTRQQFAIGDEVRVVTDREIINGEKHCGSTKGLEGIISRIEGDDCWVSFHENTRGWILSKQKDTDLELIVVWETGDTVQVSSSGYRYHNGEQGSVMSNYIGHDGQRRFIVNFPHLGCDGHYFDNELSLVISYDPVPSKRGDDVDAYFGAFTDVDAPEHYTLAYESPHFYETQTEPAGFLESHEQDPVDDYDYELYAPI